MIDRLMHWDKEAFLWLNDLHLPLLDPIMFFLTNTAAWTPLFIYLLYLIVREYGWYSAVFLVGLALTILFADQITSSIMKPYFERLRPSHEPALRDLVHVVNDYRGGKFGFASSHAANTFGAAMFLHLILRKSFRYTGVLFVWAAFVSYTRIYLGVHYPGDLIVGALIGVMLAGLFYQSSRILLTRLGKPLP